MSDLTNLTINSVCLKKQIYPMVLNFQNGYPSENFEFDCALIQDEDGNKTIATEINRLLYAGSEETEDLGQTFILARNRKTGKVRLIEVGSASLNPFSEYAIKELENSVLKPDKPDYLQRTNTSKLNSYRRNHTPEKETNYEQVKNNSQILELSELEPNIPAQNHQLQASELEPKVSNQSPLSEHNEVEPNRSNHLQSLEISELGCNGTKHSPLLEPSELKLKTKEYNLNTPNDDKDFTTVKEMFVRALGLNIKVGETVYSENNVHSSPANKKKEKIYADLNDTDDDISIVSLEDKTYICLCCNKTFEDKGSVMFHLISHKFIMNAKNALPRPLVKRIVGNTNSNDNIYRQKRRHNDRNVKKLKSEKRKVINENALKCCDGDDDAIYEGVNVPCNDSVSIQDRQEIFYNKIQVTENSKDIDDSPIHSVEEDSVVLIHPSAPERNIICDHCDETFQEKESLIFHLLTHKFINDIVQVSNIIMTNSETNEDYNEIETLKANDYYKLERENEEKNKNIRIDKIHEDRDSNDKIAKHSRVMTRRMHLAAHKSIINIRESRIITTESEPIQADKENETLRVHSPNRQPEVNCDGELEINIRTDKIREASNTSVRNNAEQTIRIMVAQMKTRENDTHNNSNKKSTAVDNTFICNDCGRKSKSKLSLITHIKCHNSSFKAKKKVTLRLPHIKSGVKEQSKKSNSEAKEGGLGGDTSKLSLIKLTRCDFLNHLNENLASEKAYKFCTLCNYKTRYASRLTRHKRAHTKSFKCKHCKKGFRKSNDLKVHLRRHSGDRPFQCRCGATFAKKNTLNRHLKTHTGEKSFNCTICTSKFKLLNGLKRHLKIHREKTYKCTSCESSFSDGSSMKRHMRSHTDQKPYRCDSCKYSTANSYDLKRHGKTCQGRCTRTTQL